MTQTAPALPQFNTIKLEREGRLLRITFNRPDVMNAVNLELHDELPEVLWFAQGDPGSDVILLTGEGRGFSAGGDLDHLTNCIENPHLFHHEARQAKRVVSTMLDIDKPVICRLNGHAIGLGATVALLCDIIIAAEGARIGDPHVGIGLVAGDGGAAIWAARIGLSRAKEYLLTGEPVTAEKAAEIGLVNKCVPKEELDATVDAFCQKMLNGAINAIRWTKILTNLELKRVATAVMDAGVAYETVSIGGHEVREGVAAIKEKRKPDFSNGRP